MSNREPVIKLSSMRKESASSDRRRAWSCLASKVRRRCYFGDTNSAFEEQRHGNSVGEEKKKDVRCNRVFHKKRVP